MRKWMIGSLLFIAVIMTTASAGPSMAGNVPKITITPAIPIPVYATYACPVSFSCKMPGDIAAAGGTGGYDQASTLPCGYGTLANGQVDPARPEYCYRLKMTSNAPKITLPATTVTPVKVITNVQRITMPTTTPTQVPIQMGSTRPVTEVATISTSATGTQAMPGGGQPGSVLDQVMENRHLSGKIASPDDYVKLNPQPEPPLPVSGGLITSVIGFFSGLFGGNKVTAGSPGVPLDS
jgi:hypothetical protein